MAASIKIMYNSNQSKGSQAKALFTAVASAYGLVPVISAAGQAAIIL
jgi:hemoglobin-like flavoprotein